MSKDFILEVANEIASGRIVPVTEKCLHTKPVIVPIDVLRSDSDVLINCPQLQIMNTGNMSQIICRHLFQFGRGCPFVLSGNVYCSNK